MSKGNDIPDRVSGSDAADSVPEDDDTPDSVPGSDAVPDRPPSGRLAEALAVRRNVAVGLAVGSAVAAVAYAVRVLELLGPAPDRGSPLLFLALAFVLAVTLAAMVATALTLARGYRLARAAEPSASEES